MSISIIIFLIKERQNLKFKYFETQKLNFNVDEGDFSWVGGLLTATSPRSRSNIDYSQIEKFKKLEGNKIDISKLNK